MQHGFWIQSTAVVPLHELSPPRARAQAQLVQHIFVEKSIPTSTVHTPHRYCVHDTTNDKIYVDNIRRKNSQYIFPTFLLRDMNDSTLLRECSACASLHTHTRVVICLDLFVRKLALSHCKDNPTHQ